MIKHIKNTKTSELGDVYFEDINELVSSKEQAWLVNGFLFRYYSTEEAAKAYMNKSSIHRKG